MPGPYPLLGQQAAVSAPAGKRPRCHQRLQRCVGLAPGLGTARTAEEVSKCQGYFSRHIRPPRSGCFSIACPAYWAEKPEPESMPHPLPVGHRKLRGSVQEPAPRAAEGITGAERQRRARQISTGHTKPRALFLVPRKLPAAKNRAGC